LTSNTNTKDQARMEATLKKKELQAREASKAMAEYMAVSRALSENTAKLRSLRLAREAAEAEAARAAKAAKTAKTAEIAVKPAKIGNKVSKITKITKIKVKKTAAAGN
jgi:hypothetical protein